LPRHVKICAVFFVFLACSAVQAQERLVFATIENTPNGRIGAAILEVAYARLGVEAEIYKSSGQRGLMLSSTGALDGEVLRFGLIGNLHPSLIRVDVPIVDFAVTVFVNKEVVSVDMIADLPRRRVGHLAGAVKLAQVTQGFDDVWKAGSNSELFEMLSAGHLEAVVSASVAGRITVNRLGLQDIVELHPPLERDALYHFLNEKHAALVPEITRVLQDMATSGELKSLVEAEIASMTKRAVSGVRPGG